MIVAECSCCLASQHKYDSCLLRLFSSSTIIIAVAYIYRPFFCCQTVCACMPELKEAGQKEIISSGLRELNYIMGKWYIQVVINCYYFVCNLIPACDQTVWHD